MQLRVRHQNGSALEIARFLERHFGGDRVAYPGSRATRARAGAVF